MGWNKAFVGHTLGAALLASACGTKTVGNVEEGSASGDSSGDTGSEGSNSQSSSATQSSSVTDTETAEVGSGTSMTSLTSATSTTEGESSESGECPPGVSVCDPQPELDPGDIPWSMDGNQNLVKQVVDAPCVVSDFQDDDVTMTIVLDCDEGELSQHVLELPHNPITPLNLGVGVSVQLTYQVQTPFWLNHWVALHRQNGSLVIGAVDASSLLPTDDFFAPLSMQVLGDVCEQECFVDECGVTRRHAIEVTDGGSSTTIYDGLTGVLGEVLDYTVVVGEAEGYIDDGECEDIPGSWYRVIVYDSGEG